MRQVARIGVEAHRVLDLLPETLLKPIKIVSGGPAALSRSFLDDERTPVGTSPSCLPRGSAQPTLGLARSMATTAGTTAAKATRRHTKRMRKRGLPRGAAEPRASRWFGASDAPRRRGPDAPMGSRSGHAARRDAPGDMRI